MSLSPILIIGCGGSGGKVVLGLRNRLEAELRRRKWDRGIPDAWQMKWIDVPTLGETHVEFGPELPLGDYVGLAPSDSYATIDAALVAGANAAMVDRLVGWRPTPNLPLPVSKGAGQMRGVGRAVVLANTNKIRLSVEQSFAKMAGGAAELSQLAAHLGAEGADPSPVVFVVSSMAGGTGAGIFMDVCDVVRAIRPEVSNKIFGFLFTAEIFKNVSGDAGMVPNTVATLGELISGYLAVDRRPDALFGPVAAVATSGKSGPSWPYVIGMQPMGNGAPLESPAQCYRAVTETILASMVNERFAQDFVNYQITNFAPNSGAQDRMTAYQMLNSPKAEGDATQPCGLVSSFGSAIVSVGSGLFGEWAADRLARSVIDHVTGGWREYGRQLMGSQATAMTQDPDIVQFLAMRDRQSFIEACGLLEEDEPNGASRDQVLDGISTKETLSEILKTLESGIRGELANSTLESGEWVNTILRIVGTKSSSFRGDVEKHLTEGAEAYAATVVSTLGEAVSRWLAKFGVPVTKELVRQLRDQCLNASDQLQILAKSAHTRALMDPKPFIAGEFKTVGGRNKTPGNSQFVAKGVAQAVGPLWNHALARRAEVAIELLGRVVPRVIGPLLAQLDDVGSALTAGGQSEKIESWPDSGGGVAPAYAPAPTEKVLLDPTDWDREYRRLLGEAAGGVEEARAQVAAGGFQFGPVVKPSTAATMTTFDSVTRWWDRDSVNVSVTIRLRPEEVLERANQWLWNENHAAGKFVRMGLEEYLSEIGEHRAGRLAKFEDALTKARALAKPLVNINPTMMQRVHPGRDALKAKIACEQFPFPPGMQEVRDIVERVMFGEETPVGGWFKPSNTANTEKVLMTAVLDNPVQPAAVVSLTAPIAQRWSTVVGTPVEHRQAAIGGFWTYNRARLLTECIPLTSPAVARITRGWFLGRLLGLVSNASLTDGFAVSYTEHGQSKAAPLPWPLLRHRDVDALHESTYATEWLPALFEHLPLAMMLLGNDPTALDGYEYLYRIGNSADSLISEWIRTGTTQAQALVKPQVAKVKSVAGLEGPEARKDALQTALQALQKIYQTRVSSTIVIAEWQQFRTIPYGHEFSALFAYELDGLLEKVQSSATESADFG